MSLFVLFIAFASQIKKQCKIVFVINQLVMMSLSKCYNRVIKKKTPTNFASVGAIHFNSRSNYSTTIFLFETEFPEVIETRYIPF